MHFSVFLGQLYPSPSYNIICRYARILYSITYKYNIVSIYILLRHIDDRFFYALYNDILNF
jgi:hypothetical protein